MKQQEIKISKNEFDQIIEVEKTYYTGIYTIFTKANIHDNGDTINEITYSTLVTGPDVLKGLKEKFVYLYDTEELEYYGYMYFINDTLIIHKERDNILVKNTFDYGERDFDHLRDYNFGKYIENPYKILNFLLEEELF